MQMLISQPGDRALVDAIKAHLLYSGFAEVFETYASGAVRIGVADQEERREEFEGAVRMLDADARRFD